MSRPVTQQSSPRRRPLCRRRRGLSLVEVMISLAITAMLLTACAAAFSASAQAIEQNDQFFRATQAARISIGRILADVRRGTVDDNSTPTSLRVIVGTNDRTYQYIAAERRLVMITNDGINDPPYTLARNVASVAFDTSDQLEDDNGTTYVARAIVDVAVRVGKNEVRLSGSAAPRKYLTY